MNKQLNHHLLKMKEVLLQILSQKKRSRFADATLDALCFQKKNILKQKSNVSPCSHFILNK